MAVFCVLINENIGKDKKYTYSGEFIALFEKGVQFLVVSYIM